MTHKREARCVWIYTDVGGPRGFADGPRSSETGWAEQEEDQSQQHPSHEDHGESEVSSICHWTTGPRYYHTCTKLEFHFLHNGIYKYTSLKRAAGAALNGFHYEKNESKSTNTEFSWEPHGQSQINCLTYFLEGTLCQYSRTGIVWAKRECKRKAEEWEEKQASKVIIPSSPQEKPSVLPQALKGQVGPGWVTHFLFYEEVR